MLLQFKVIADNSLWIADVYSLTWARVSSPGIDPESKVLEYGRLRPLGWGRYEFEGRTPKTSGPGAGLSVITVNTPMLRDTGIVEIRPNVDVTDFTMPVPIKQILYRVLPSDPKQIEEYYNEAFNGGNSNTASDPGGDSSVALDPETTEETGQGETGPGTPDGGSLGGEPAGVS